MAYPRFSFKTKPRKGHYFHMIIEDHGKNHRRNRFMAQLTKCAALPDPNNLHSEDLVLDHFPTIEEACDAINYPFDVAGYPKLK